MYAVDVTIYLTVKVSSERLVTMVTALELVQSALDALGHGDECHFVHQSGIGVQCRLRDPDAPVNLRLLVPLEFGADMQLPFDVATLLLSETTHNDACDITVRVRAAHFNLHADISDDTDETKFAVYDVIITDYMS